MRRSKLSEAGLEPRLLLASAACLAAAIPAAVIAYAATHGWAPLHRLDTGVATGLHSWALGAPHAVGFLEGVSTVVGPWPLRAVTLGVVVVLATRGQRRLALWAGATVAVAGIVGFALKLIVARSRPSLPDPVATAAGSSFPSGHALNSFVIIGVLVLLALPTVPRRLRPVVWAAAAGTVLLVGFARVALGVHYVSDVVAGWLIGAGLLAATVVAFETWRRPTARPVGEVLGEGVDPAGSRAAVGSATRKSDSNRNSD